MRNLIIILALLFATIWILDHIPASILDRSVTSEPRSIVKRVEGTNIYTCEGPDCGNFPVESSDDVVPVILPEWEVLP